MSFDTAGIPIVVLEGKVRKYRSVGAIYKANFTKRIVTLLNESFWIRATGSQDPKTGSKWKKLKKITEKIKTRQIENPYEDAGSPDQNFPHVDRKYETNRYLTPSQQSQYKQLLRKYKVKGSISRRALAAVDPDKRLKERALKNKVSVTPINVRTGRLVSATFPGNISNNRYYAVKDQHVQWDGLNFEFDILVPYADEVDEAREIVPANYLPWIKDAHQYAIGEAVKEYTRINNAARRKKPGRMKSRNRPRN